MDIQKQAEQSQHKGPANPWNATTARKRKYDNGNGVFKQQPRARLRKRKAVRLRPAVGQGPGSTRARKYDYRHHGFKQQPDKEPAQRTPGSRTTARQGATTACASRTRTRLSDSASARKYDTGRDFKQWPSDKAKARVTGARLLQAAGRQSKCSELWKQFARRECARVYAVTVCHCTHGSCA